jgi:mannitol-specific phosphotransferase system IIBC component
MAHYNKLTMKIIFGKLSTPRELAWSLAVLIIIVVGGVVAIYYPIFAIVPLGILIALCGRAIFSQDLRREIQEFRERWLRRIE